MEGAFNGSEPFWDAAAPYEGPTLYARHEGREVVGPFVRTVQFRMSAGDSCIARGVMEAADGRLYTWTVRAGKHADRKGHRRLATLLRSGTFEENARGLFAFERHRIDPDRIAEYGAQLNAL